MTSLEESLQVAVVLLSLEPVIAKRGIYLAFQSDFISSGAKDKEYLALQDA
jgi:hypothetical protein